MQSTRRRRWRVVLLVGGVLFLGLLTWLFALRAYWQRELDRAIAELEREVGPLDYARWTDAPRGSELADDNAAKWLIAGADAIVLDEGERDLLSAVRAHPVLEWSAAEIEASRALVARHSGALETMARAVPLAGARFPLRLDGSVAGDERAADDPVPSLLIRQVHGARVLLLAGRLALRDGDCGSAARRAELLARQGGALGREPTFLALIGANVTWQLLELTREALLVCEDLAVMDRWQALLVEVERTRWPADRALGVEATFSLAQMLQAVDEGGSLWERWLGPNAGGVLSPVVDLQGALIAASRVSAAEVERVALGFAYDERSGRRNVIASMLAPQRSAEAQRLLATDATVQMARAALAIRLEGLRSGAYPAPEAVSDLARSPTSYLGEVPIYEVGLDGARVAIPRSAARWREQYVGAGQGSPRPEPPFELMLPPLLEG